MKIENNEIKIQINKLIKQYCKYIKNSENRIIPDIIKGVIEFFLNNKKLNFIYIKNKAYFRYLNIHSAKKIIRELIMNMKK